MKKEKFDIAVIGGGLAGLTAALALEKTGRSVSLIAPVPAHADGRTTALLVQSVETYEKLGTWEKASEFAMPLRTMRIIDALDRLIKAPQVDFHASEIKQDAFGYNIANADLSKVLVEQIEASQIKWYQEPVKTINLDSEAVFIETVAGEKISADLIVGADGRGSPTRQAAEIDLKTVDYPQSAIVTNFTHTLPHGDVSTEFHTPTGPFTTVPLTKKSSSLVWVETPAEAERLSSLPLAELSVIAERKMQSFLGKITIDKEVQRFPLSAKTASCLGKGRAVLVGEAGHVFPPIGAQGFNLGIRDVIALEELVASTPIEQWSSLGEAYNTKRKVDVAVRTASVDALNRSLLSGLLPVQFARSLGLYLLGTVGPLKRFVMKEGMTPGASGFGLRDKIRVGRR